MLFPYTVYAINYTEGMITIEKIDRAALGRRVAEARKQAGLTSEQLADQSGVSAVYIRQIESGRYQPSIATLIALSSALHKSLDFLVQDSQTGWNELKNLRGIAGLCQRLTPEQTETVRRMIASMFPPDEP